MIPERPGKKYMLLEWYFLNRSKMCTEMYCYTVLIVLFQDTLDALISDTRISEHNSLKEAKRVVKAIQKLGLKYCEQHAYRGSSQSENCRSEECAAC